MAEFRDLQSDYEERRLAARAAHRAKIVDRDKSVPLDMRNADLRGIDLAGHDLTNIDFSHALFHNAKLAGSTFSGDRMEGVTFENTDARSADFSRADLNRSHLAASRLESTDFFQANLEHAVLVQCQLSDATFTSANLFGVNFVGGGFRDTGGNLLMVTGMASGIGTMVPTHSGWQVRVGCWKGTVDSLQELIRQDTGWPEAYGHELQRRRPVLQAFIQLARVYMETYPQMIEQAKNAWGPKPKPAVAEFSLTPPVVDAHDDELF
jgi:hypothetical protein